MAVGAAVWVVPAGLLAALLLVEMIVVISQHGPRHHQRRRAVTPKEVGLALFGPYVLAVEIASMLLLAGLVGAYHLGRRFIDAREASTDGRPAGIPMEHVLLLAAALFTCGLVGVMVRRNIIFVCSCHWRSC